MYGFLRGLLPTLQEARRQERPWVYADRGYFRATHGNAYSGYFRVTRDAMQHDGRGEFSDERWKALAMTLEPWQKGGRYILVCPPSDVYSRAVGGFSAMEWLEATLGTLRGATEREIRVRPKPKAGSLAPPLSFDLKNANALVTYVSNTAVEAVLAGVPVFCTGQCAASSMGQADLSMIEEPIYPDREGWVAALAANQWTLDEIRAGKANGVFE